MDQEYRRDLSPNRRGFLKTTGAGIGAAGLSLAPAGQAAARALSEKDKLARIASNTWPIRHIFKSRTTYTQTQKSGELKKKYGELTMLDFPQFTKDTFPGVYHMDLEVRVTETFDADGTVSATASLE